MLFQYYTYNQSIHSGDHRKTNRNATAFHPFWRSLQYMKPRVARKAPPTPIRNWPAQRRENDPLTARLAGCWWHCEVMAELSRPGLHRPEVAYTGTTMANKMASFFG